MPFRELPHTADVQFEITGTSLAELFSESVRALSSTVTDLEAIRGKEERMVSAEGATLPELLINFLRACLQAFNTDRFLARSCEIMELQERGELRVRAKLRGERFEEGRHSYKTEIKAVTYHGAMVEERGAGGFRAVFTLDV